MTTYKGIIIDGTIIKNRADVDAYLEGAALRAFENATRLFYQTLNLEASVYADEMATKLVKEYGYGWDNIEKMELDILREMA